MERLSRRQAPGGPVRGLFTFVLLAAFAVLALLVVLVGARVYGAIEDRSEENYGARTALSYAAGKVRAVNGADVSVMAEGETRVLVLGMDAGGARYHTYLYFDGAESICEYFGRADRAFDPALGQPIIAAAGFDAAIDGDVLTLTVTRAAGAEQTLSLTLRGRDGA